MAENDKQQNSNGSKSTSYYHLSAQVSDTFFSYKKPSDGKAYAMMYIKMYDDRISFHFKRGVTSDNVLDLDCYMHEAKAYDISQWLEGFMARRRDAYMQSKPYDADEMIKVPMTSFRNGTEVPVGTLVIDTEMIEGIPRLRITYTDNEKNDSIEVVFNKRVPNGTIEMSKPNAFKIDYADVGAFNFVTTFKELQNPLVPIMYKFQDAALSTIIKFVSRCFNKNEHRCSGGNDRNKWSYSSNNGRPNNSNRGGGYTRPDPETSQDEPSNSNEWPDDDAM